MKNESTPQFDYNLYEEANSIYLIAYFDKPTNLNVNFNLNSYINYKQLTKNVILNYTINPLNHRQQIHKIPYPRWNVLEFTVYNNTLEQLLAKEEKFLEWQRRHFWPNFENKNDHLNTMYIRPIGLNTFRMAIACDYFTSVQVDKLVNLKSSIPDCNKSEIVFYGKFEENANLDVDICTILQYELEYPNYSRNFSGKINHTLNLDYNIVYPKNDFSFWNDPIIRFAILNAINQAAYAIFVLFAFILFGAIIATILYKYF